MNKTFKILVAASVSMLVASVALAYMIPTTYLITKTDEITSPRQCTGTISKGTLDWSCGRITVCHAWLVKKSNPLVERKVEIHCGAGFYRLNKGDEIDVR